MKIIRQCRKCKKSFSINVNSKMWLRWTHGIIPIQEAFPKLNVNQREILMSGECARCF